MRRCRGPSGGRGTVILHVSPGRPATDHPEEPRRAGDAPSAPFTASSPAVVILNGPAGVGKTTAARLLASTVGNGACVHGDAFKGFIVRRQDGAVRQGLGFLNGASVVTNFVESGYDLVVFEKPDGLEVFRCGYGASAPVHLFTLWADLETVIQRERHREGRERLGQRVCTCYGMMEQHLPALGRIIDTTQASPAMVASHIAALCIAGEGLLIPARPPARPAVSRRSRRGCG